MLPEPLARREGPAVHPTPHHENDGTRPPLVDDPKPLAKTPAMLRRPGFAAGLLGACLALLACAAPPPPSEDGAQRPRPPSPEPTARIEALEAAIARDEAAIKAMISDPARVPGLREDPELLAIADRLPRLQAELAELRPAAPVKPSSETSESSEEAPGERIDPAQPPDGEPDVE